MPEKKCETPDCQTLIADTHNLRFCRPCKTARVKEQRQRNNRAWRERAADPEVAARINAKRRMARTSKKEMGAAESWQARRPKPIFPAPEVTNTEIHLKHLERMGLKVQVGGVPASDVRVLTREEIDALRSTITYVMDIRHSSHLSPYKLV
jgi:hypothetical protein